MAMKMTKADFMGMSEEWLAGYEAAKAEERTCEGCVFDSLYANNCSFCNRDPRLTDQFIAKVVE